MAREARERRGHVLAGAVVVATVLAGLGLRLFWLLSVTPQPVSDGRSYANAALELAAGHGYHARDLPTAYYPVGYAATLALFHKLFGPEVIVARLANLCLAAVTLVAVYLVARVLTQSKLSAWFALLLYALYPADIAYTTLTLSQPAFNAFALAGAALCLWKRPAPLWRVFLGGVLIGWATLTRAQGIVVVLGLCLLWLSERQRSQRVAAGLLALAFVCTLAPWAIRNAYYLHGFVPVSTNNGINLYIGNNPSARGVYHFPKTLEPPLYEGIEGPRRGGPNEVLIDRRATHLALDWARQEPGAALALWKPKLHALFHTDAPAFGNFAKRVPTPEQTKLLRQVRPWNERYYFVLLGLCALGLVRVVYQLVRRRLTLGSLLPAALVAAFTLLHLLTFGDACYHHPMMPWVVVYSGHALGAVHALFSRVRSAYPRELEARIS